MLCSDPLCCVLRYAGHSDWFRSDQRGRFNWDFLNHKDTALEEVDVSHTVINYNGLENLGTEIRFCWSLILSLCGFQAQTIRFTDGNHDRNVGSERTEVHSHSICLLSGSQRSLRTLSLRGCPEVDDWFLARLHMFQDSLEELDISHCPRISAGGLAALRNLKYPNTPRSVPGAEVFWLILCVLQGSASPGRVGPPWALLSWTGPYPAGGNVTTVPDHRFWLRPQSEDGHLRRPLSSGL